MGHPMTIPVFDPNVIQWEAAFTILGEPASKANQRRFGRDRAGTSRLFKSKKATAFVRTFGYQCPTLDPLLTGNLVVAMKIFYASRRPDLDESLILDCLQGRVYENDRQVKERHIYWGLDRDKPRTAILIARIQ